MEPLKTLKGSKIWYSKFGVGKRVSSKIYAHIKYHDKIVPEEIWLKAISVLQDYDYKLSEFNCFCYDLYDPTVVRFDQTKGFDTEREPTVGRMVGADTVGWRVCEKYSPQIWHHKWLWVNEDYKGFDIKESYEWSKLWLSKVNEVASGSTIKWKEQLRKVGLE